MQRAIGSRNSKIAAPTHACFNVTDFDETEVAHELATSLAPAN
jgi:hypothetical protein